ncbi:MAG: hypothetical protein ACRCVE_10470, partial [Plesiomonas sp.]
MIDANILFNGTHYPVKLNSIPAIGDYIELTSLTELKLQRQHVFTLKVVNICHAIMEFKAP